MDFDIPANWKLVWENNRECYHCNANHPQYIKANFDHYNADDTSERIQAALDAQTARSEARWAASGLAVSHKAAGMTVVGCAGLTPASRLAGADRVITTMADLPAAISA